MPKDVTKPVESTTALSTAEESPTAVLARVITVGDLSQLSYKEKIAYYNAVCESVGLNPLTRPFEYMKLQGKEVLYARKDATEQLRKIHKVSVDRLEKEIQNDIYIVTAYGSAGDGRHDVGTGAVSIKGLSGDSLANAYMKCETKAKRRFTLSICGLGVLDESELETVGATSGSEPPGDPRDIRPRRRSERRVEEQGEPEGSDSQETRTAEVVTEAEPVAAAAAGGGGNGGGGNGKITPETFQAVFKLIPAYNEQNGPGSAMRLIEDSYGVKSVTKLSEEQGRELVEKLESLLGG